MFGTILRRVSKSNNNGQFLNLISNTSNQLKSTTTTNLNHRLFSTTTTTSLKSNSNTIQNLIQKNNSILSSNSSLITTTTTTSSTRLFHSSKNLFAGTKYHEFLGPLHRNTPKEFPTTKQQNNENKTESESESTTTPTSFAVVHIGGHQYKVSEGDLIFTEKLDAPVSSQIIFNKVLLFGTTTQTRIGAPLLDGIDIHAIVEEQTLADKELIFKKKRRKHYRRLNGHRQPLTTLRIQKIVANENETATTETSETQQQQQQ